MQAGQRFLLFANPEDRFSRVKDHMSLKIPHTNSGGTTRKTQQYGWRILIFSLALILEVQKIWRYENIYGPAHKITWVKVHVKVQNFQNPELLKFKF